MAWCRGGARYAELQQLAGFGGSPRIRPHSRLRILNEFHALIVAVGKNHCAPQARCRGDAR